MKTALYSQHQSLGAKIVSFGDWEMPVQYKSILHEHQTVRAHVGIFDVSHMGVIIVTGKDAERFLDYLSTNIIKGKKDFTATYTVWCNEKGMCVDDVIVYRYNAEHFFVIVNAANRQKDLAHLQNYGKNFDVRIVDHFNDDGIIAIQGPKAEALVSEIFDSARTLKHMHFLSQEYHGEEIVVSRTGYTGDDGFEIYASSKQIVELWELFLTKGKNYGIEPVGLGARDTLRLEAGYALYGHEINEYIAPTESVSAWTVKLNEHDFLGKTFLLELEQLPKKRFEYGIVLQDKGVPRDGFAILSKNKIIGKITSGTFSPSLHCGIAIVIVDEQLNIGDTVKVAIKDRLIEAKVVEIPFYKRKT